MSSKITDWNVVVLIIKDLRSKVRALSPNTEIN